MIFSEPAPDQINVEVFVRDGCRYSERVLTQLIQIENNFPETNFVVIDASDIQSHPRPQGGITPSIWVNGKLWFLGTFCADKFCSKLDQLTQPN